MRILKDTNIDFLKYKAPAILVSLIIIGAGLFLIFKNGLKYGVDFTGGTALHIKFRQPVSTEAVRSALRDAGFRDSGVQSFKDKTQVLVRMPVAAATAEKIGETASKVNLALQTRLLKKTPPSGLRDLNLAFETEIHQYLIAQDPWGVKDGQKYKGEAAKISQLKKENTGIYPSLDQFRGVDPKIVNSLKQSYYVGDLAILSSEFVGPQVGAELRNQARLAIMWSLLGLLVYVAFRFHLLWGASAILCLAHDVLVTLAFFAFFGREISLTVVAGFLTIVGFSLNDTIVIYDRVRDNLKTMRTQPLESVINLSLNQMLSRTILTNGTVLAVVLVLYTVGGEVINDFAFAMLVGCISGIYSTVYIASALIVVYTKYFGKKKVQTSKAKAARKVS